MNRLIILALIFLIFSCSSNSKISKVDRISDRVIVDFSKSFCENRFHLAGIGGGLDASKEKINKLSVVFGTDKIENLNAARKLFVETIQNFLAYINSNEDIRDYLISYPFSIENVDIGFVFEYAEPGEIVFLIQKGNRLSYYAKPLIETDNQRVEVCEESFEEAVLILSRWGQK